MSGPDELAGDPAATRPPIATRAPAPTPRRLSRKALVTLTGVSALGVAAALGYSLTAGHRSSGTQETVSIDRRNKDALADAPKDYGDVARTASAGIVAPLAGTTPITTPPVAGPATGVEPPRNNEAAADQQRRRQQRDSARASKLFASTDEGGRTATPAAEPAAAPPGEIGAAETKPAFSDAQDRKAAFVTGGTGEPTVNSGRLAAPAGRYVVSAGSTIAAALITGLSSDLPGQVVAQVTEDVFDTVTGRTRLIPQGTRLLGSYDARVTYGQSRALVVWTRMIFPDGRSIELDRMLGTDGAGQSGFADRVNNHMGKLLTAGLLSTLLGVGANAATAGGDNADIAFAIRESAGRSVETAGDKIVSRQLDVQPTITIRPGARVRVLVSLDLLLSPWPAG
ncbi:TrbI/VirB10 family protein [Sphingomonas nostoxanthinifaciens]|uniref:TrbI/VirB10 family protein n=1 Tax=Sphingomonas nostoxanthinifaciens TaxID=2872652 RepID=UPI001CC1EB33|nr:TrbI/VirB10 family protein [Sphingomonas nostoxanthinifaciens]UAK23808.1 conjugal transfer protein TraI [Sphingomonas nostoxanthinifaciens]